MSDWIQLCVCVCVCSVHSAVHVRSVQWMMGTVVRGEVQQLKCGARVHSSEWVTSGGERTEVHGQDSVK